MEDEPMTGGTMQARALNQMDLQAQQELDHRFCEAMSRKDLNGVMSCLWNDPNLIVVLFDGTVYRGWESVREAVGHLFSSFLSVRLDIDEVTHIPLGDGAAAVGTATYQLQARDGSTQRIVERWTDLRRKVDGRWIYVLDHAHALPAA
jgi:ketosteroid isomerase-like protein